MERTFFVGKLDELTATLDGLREWLAQEPSPRSRLEPVRRWFAEKELRRFLEELTTEGTEYTFHIIKRDLTTVFPGISGQTDADVGEMRKRLHRAFGRRFVKAHYEQQSSGHGWLVVVITR